MKRSISRLALILFVLVWLIAMSFPFFAFVLANNDEIAVGSSSGSRVRIFLVRSKEQSGIALEWSRPIVDGKCYKTTVKYILWEGGDVNQNAEFCRCTDPSSGKFIDQTSCS
jgi:hypothetical protein